MRFRDIRDVLERVAWGSGDDFAEIVQLTISTAQWAPDGKAGYVRHELSVRAYVVRPDAFHGWMAFEPETDRPLAMISKRADSYGRVFVQAWSVSERTKLNVETGIGFITAIKAARCP